HQLPDHHAAGAGRARRLRRYRGGDLLQQRVRRALELRGRAVGARRRAHRAHGALRLPPCRAAAGAPRPHRRLHAARAHRLGRDPDDWGALGGMVGRLAGDYWQGPGIVGVERVPTSEEMKHFGAALASYGSVALFHMAGITPEARRLDEVLAPGRTVRSHDVGEADIRAFQESYAEAIEIVDVVVFSAPQLSLVAL